MWHAAGHHGHAMPRGQAARPGLRLQLGAAEGAGREVPDQDGEVHAAAVLRTDQPGAKGAAAASRGPST